MTVSEAVFLSLLISACGLQEDEKELNPKALPFYFARNSNESSLAKFLKEPELGTSWYDPGGPTPNFVSGQTNGTTYSARLGADALLDCRVTSLERDLVSWFRRGGDLGGGLPVVLTVGFRPHSSENRFILDFGPPNNYRLRVHSVRWRDEGLYLCQISVHPPALLWSRLIIERPIVHLLDSESNPVRDLHYDSGSTIEMVCRVRRPPAYHTRVVWEARYAHSPGRLAVLNQDVTRGGVKVDTGREAESGTVVSRLSLARAREEDTGNYSCRLAKMPTRRAAASKNGLTDTVTVHVLRGENTEAIQSGATSLRKALLLAPLGAVVVIGVRLDYFR